MVNVQYQLIKTRNHCNQRSTLVTEVSKLWRKEPIKVWCCLSIPPEDSRKPKGFLMFSGGIDKQKNYCTWSMYNKGHCFWRIWRYKQLQYYKKGWSNIIELLESLLLTEIFHYFTVYLLKWRKLWQNLN